MRTIFALALLLVTTAQSNAAGPTTREECRASTKTEEIVQCIQAQLYDPCDDAGSKWGQSQCAWAHLEIAERRVQAAEREIVLRLNAAKARDMSARSVSLQRQWRAYRESHCRLVDSTVDVPSFKGGSYSHAGFCLRRLTEQRASELEAVLNGPR